MAVGGFEINLLKSFSLRVYERSCWWRISLPPKLVSKLIAPLFLILIILSFSYNFHPLRFLYYMLLFFKSVSLMGTIYSVDDHVSQVIPLVSLQPTPLLTNLSFSLTNNLNLHTRNYNINFRHCNDMKSDMTSLEPFC